MIDRVLTRKTPVLFFLTLALIQAAENPEPAGWFAGDAHVHCDCGVAGGLTVTPEEAFAAMKTNSLAVVSLLADMGSGEVREANRDFLKINGRDFPLSTPQQITGMPSGTSIRAA